MPRTPTTAANPATLAGLSAPPCGEDAVGGLTEFVGEGPAIPFEVVEVVTLLFPAAIVPPEDLNVVTFAATGANPELAVTIGVDDATTVIFDEAVGVGVD